MKDQLEQELCKQYPEIFKDARHPDPAVTAMHWGISVGDGWYHIIRNGCGLIQNHINQSRRTRARALRYNRAIKRALAGDPASLIKTFASKDGTLTRWQQQDYDAVLAAGLRFKTVPDACEQVVATQVKEKFGDMRFYYSGGDRYTDGVIDLMEAMTATTCDNCGSVGAKGGTGWITVKCAPCRIGFQQTLANYSLDDNSESQDQAQ